MFKYVLKRVALMIMTLFIIISMCFIFVKLLPNEVPKVFGKDMEIIMARREALLWLSTAFGIVWLWLEQQGQHPEVIIRQKHRYNKTRPYKHGKKF